MIRQIDYPILYRSIKLKVLLFCRTCVKLLSMYYKHYKWYGTTTVSRTIPWHYKQHTYINQEHKPIMPIRALNA
jgi:hypothetical protein